MKTIFTYDYLDDYGKAHYQSIEISDEEEKEWINLDFERRMEESTPEERKNIKPRTLQDMMNELNQDSFNSDRKEFRHRDIKQEVEDEEGNKISKVELEPDNTKTQEDKLIEEEHQQLIKDKNEEALSILTPTQRKRIIKRYKEGMTLSKIAIEEETSIASVDESIKSGLKKIKKYFK